MERLSTIAKHPFDKYLEDLPFYWNYPRAIYERELCGLQFALRLDDRLLKRDELEISIEFQLPTGRKPFQQFCEANAGHRIHTGLRGRDRNVVWGFGITPIEAFLVRNADDAMQLVRGLLREYERKLEHVDDLQSLKDFLFSFGNFATTIELVAFLILEIEGEEALIRELPSLPNDRIAARLAQLYPTKD